MRMISSHALMTGRKEGAFQGEKPGLNDRSHPITPGSCSEEAWKPLRFLSRKGNTKSKNDPTTKNAAQTRPHTDSLVIKKQTASDAR